MHPSRKLFRLALWALAAAAFTLSSVLCGSAAAAAAAAPGTARIADNLTSYTLENGMRVFIYPRKSTPTFAGMIYVDAGSAEEQVGETGLAHLLEHMAFKGTPFIGTKNWPEESKLLIEIDECGKRLNRARQTLPADSPEVARLAAELAALQKRAAEHVIPNEYDNVVTQGGGQEINATTDVDYTNYFLSMPANKLEVWASLESQRLLYPSWREFYAERDVVAEERRMRTEDSPTGKLYEHFISTAFLSHPYHSPTIGWMSDLYNLTVERTQRFYQAWYVPENIVAILVGDVDPAEVKTVMQKYFGSIPARSSPQKTITVEPPQVGTRRVQVNFAAQPELMIGWHKPTFPDSDTYVFEVIQYLLTNSGRTSRLYTELVKKQAVCSQVGSFTAPGDKYPNLLALVLTPRAPHTAAEVEAAALKELERIKQQPISEAELEKIRNQIDAAFLKELESNMGLARKLGYYFLASRNPDILDDMRDAMKRVTPQDVQRVAAKYLTTENMTVAELVTKAADAAPAPAQAPGAAAPAAGAK